MRLRINTVFEEIHSGEAEEVVLPGEDGELSVKDFHQPIVCRLMAGAIRIIARRSVKSIHITDGIAHMEGDTLKIMAEVA